MASFDNAYAKTANLEGGLNPNDEGSVSLYGIRRVNNPKWDGWKTYDSLKKQGLDDTKIQKIVMGDKALKSSAKEYYRQNYWAPLSLNGVKDDDVAFEIFDHGVNAGVGTSAGIVNKSLGIKNKTTLDMTAISEINILGKDALNPIRKGRDNYYKSLGNSENQSGWLKRIGFGSTQTEDIGYEQTIDVETQAMYDKNKSLRDATLPDKATAFGLNASVNSTTNDMVNYFNKSNITGAKDIKWMSSMTDNNIVGGLMNQYGIDSIHFQDIKNSESKGHFERIVDSIQQEEAQQNYIGMRLGSTGMFASGLVGGSLMSPENLLLPMLIPLRATRAIITAKEAMDVINTSKIALRSAQALRPAISTMQNVNKFETSIIAAEQLAFANKADSIRKVAMLQGVGLAVATPNIKYTVNKDYSQSDFIFDLVTYGTIDPYFINAASKGAKTEVLDATRNIIARLDSHYKSLSDSSIEHGKVVREATRQDNVNKSAERVRANQERINATIRQGTEELIALRKSQEATLAIAQSNTAEAMLKLKANVNAETKRLLKQRQAEEEVIQKRLDDIKESVNASAQKVKQAQGRVNETIRVGTEEIIGVKKAKAEFVDASAQKVKEAQARINATINAGTDALKGARTNLANLRVYLNTLADDVGEAVRHHQISGSTQSFARVQEAQAKVAAVENDIRVIEDALSKQDTLAIDTAIDTVKQNIDNLKVATPVKVTDDDIADVKEIMESIDVSPLSVKDAIKVIDEAGLSDFVKADGTVEAKLSVDKDGNFQLKSGKKKMSLPKKVALAFMALEGFALADSGDGYSFIKISGFAVLALILGGSYYLKGVRDNTKGLETAKNIGSILKSKIMEGVSENGFGKMLYNGAELLAGSWSETAKPLIESLTTFRSKVVGKDISVSDIARIIIRDQRNLGKQEVEALEDLSATFIASNKYGFVTKETEVLTRAYNEAKTTMSIGQRKTNLLFENQFMSSLRKEATKLVENPTATGNKYASEIATHFSNSMSNILKIAQRLNIDGAKGLTNFVPRYWKTDDAYQILLQNPDASEKLYKNLLNGFMGAGAPYPKAKALAEQRLTKLSANLKGMRVEERKQLELDEISDRFKDREPFDKNSWVPFSAKIDGKEITVDMSHFIEDDIAIIFDRYLYEMSGHVALAHHGFTNYSKFYALLDEIPNKVERETLTELTDTIFGKEVVDHSSTGFKTAQIIRNVAVAVLLPLGGINMIGELYRLAFKTSGKQSGLSYMANRVMDATLASGSDSSWFNMMQNFHGAGMDARIGTLTHRGFAETTIAGSSASADAMDGVLQLSARARDFTMLFSQLPKLTDFARNVSMELNMDLLARYLNGSQQIHPLDLEAWGLTDKTISLLKDVLPLNSKGYMKKIDPNTFTPSQQAEFKRVIRNMGMTDIQMHTLGGTAQYTRNSTLGIALSGLMGFAMQSYVTHGLRDVKGISQGRPESFLSMSLWLAGGMTTYYIKAMLQGKDYNEEDAFAYAGTMLPVASPLSFPSMLTNPAGFGAMELMMMSPYESIKTTKALLENE